MAGKSSTGGSSGSGPWVSHNQFSVFAGGAAGFASTCITNPFDVLRSRMAASVEATGAATRTLTAQLQAMSRDGLLRSFSAGLGVNLVTSVPTNAIYLSSYRYINRASADALGKDHAMVPIIGAVGAVSATNGTLAPMFTIRTRCQLQPSETAFGIAKDIMRNEGLRGFYRGAATNAVGRMAEEATFWFLYENAKRVSQQGDMSQSLAWGSLGVIGLSSITKMIGSGLSYPYNVVMTHLREVDRTTGKHNHNSVPETIRYVYRKDGVAGFYRGCSAHLLRCALSKASQIWVFELVMVSGAALYTVRGDGKPVPQAA